MTDGASAVYGSDAVGGVVNFIMKKDYRGSETSVRYEDSSSGGHRRVIEQTLWILLEHRQRDSVRRAIARTIPYSRAMPDSTRTGITANRAADSTPITSGQPGEYPAVWTSLDRPAEHDLRNSAVWRRYQLQSGRRHMGVQRRGRDPVRELQPPAKGAFAHR